METLISSVYAGDSRDMHHNYAPLQSPLPPLSPLLILAPPRLLDWSPRFCAGDGSLDSSHDWGGTHWVHHGTAFEASIPEGGKEQKGLDIFHIFLR